jgi:hypothetical protein
MNCILCVVSHSYTFMIDHAKPEFEEPMEQAQVEDFTNLELDQGKRQCITPKPLSFIFETLFIILFDCALSLQDLYDTVAALGFSFPIILVYP